MNLNNSDHSRCGEFYDVDDLLDELVDECVSLLGDVHAIIEQNVCLKLVEIRILDAEILLRIIPGALVDVHSGGK